MVICSRCQKRPAVVFVTKIEGNESKQEGLCIKCARELGLKPVSDIIDKMGLTDEDLDRMDSDLSSFMENFDASNMPDIMAQPERSGDDSSDGRAPVINFQKLMSDCVKNEGQKSENSKGDASSKAKKDRKNLEAYCTNLTAKAADGKLEVFVTGYGHGVGMSQYGANQMAKEGADYRTILTHYYTGVTVEPYTTAAMG